MRSEYHCVGFMNNARRGAGGRRPKVNVENMEESARDSLGEGLSDVGNDPSPYGSMKSDQQELTHALCRVVKGNLLARRKGRNLRLLPGHCFLREGRSRRNPVSLMLHVPSTPLLDLLD